MSHLQPGVLDGVHVGVAGGGELGVEVTRACAALGATVTGVGPADLPEPLHVLVVDAAEGFATGGLRAATDDTWVAVRAAGVERMIPARDGRVVLLAPRARAGAHAEPARDALENLARTLSIEWSRHGIRVTAIHPAAGTPAADVAGLAAFLASPAGDYYSGCRFSLGEAVARPA